MTTLGILGIDWYQFENFMQLWAPIILMGVLVYLVWRTLKLMPRTKPQQITPRSASSVTWGDIAGVEETKEELREVVEFLRRPRQFKALGATVPKGILLHGPPGTGKTLLAKAVAHESGANFFGQSASSFVEMFAGLGAARIRRLFKQAREHAPAIVFIDELDAVGAHRGSDISGERDQTLNQLLVEMDGFDASDNVIVMAASDMSGRERILGVHTRSKPLAQDVDLERVARHTAGLTGADLANLCNEAAILAGRRRREVITQGDFEDAFERVVAGLQSRKVITDHEKRVVAWHESGHALVSELLPSVDKVQKVSIVPRGKALGYTLNLPQEDRYLKSREELIDYMKVLLAGRVSEQITFGRITTGASDDLKRVTDIARSMVHEYGMGTQIRSHQVAADDYTVSDALRQTRDEEVTEISEEAYRGAYRLLVDHRDLLDEIAERLLAHEVIEHEEIRAIMARGRVAPEVDAERGEPARDRSRAGDRAAALASKPPEAERR